VTLVSSLVAPALAHQERRRDRALDRRQVVHYHMVGVYDGAAVIAYREPAGQATVTDRVEIDLDWDAKAGAIVGEPGS
jgi:hypothetical protein